MIIAHSKFMRDLKYVKDSPIKKCADVSIIKSLRSDEKGIRRS